MKEESRSFTICHCCLVKVSEAEILMHVIQHISVVKTWSIEEGFGCLKLNFNKKN